MYLTKNVSLFLIVLSAVNAVALPTNNTKTASFRNPNNNDPNPICVPTRWTDIATFFIGNYFAHAATVKLHPGESALPAILAFVSALLLPTSGLIRGLNGVLRHASFRKRGFGKAFSRGSDYQTAVAAGALCMVVRTKFWRPQTGDEISDVILRGKCSPPPDRKNADNNFLEMELNSEEQEATEKKLKVYSPPWAQEQGRFWIYTDTLSENVDPSRVIHGSYDFKCQRRSYALAYVPRDAKVESTESPTRPVHLNAIERGKEEEHDEDGITPATYPAIEEPNTTLELALAPLDGLAVEEPLCPNPDRPIQQIMSASYNLPKAIIAIIQLIYATTTLYQSRGNQITIYGYAAFGLTVVPYAIMSLVNLISALVTPDYPALFMVGSDIMDEAIRRGAMFDGVVGRLVLDPQPTTQKATPTATVVSVHKDDVFVSEFLYRCKDKESKFTVTIIDYPTPTDEKDRELKTVDKADTDLSPSVFVPSCSKFRREDYRDFELNIYKTSMTLQGLFIFSVGPHHSTRGMPLSIVLSDHFPMIVPRPFKQAILLIFKMVENCVPTVLLINGLVVFAVIGGLSHFNPGLSTNSQRGWTMTWCVLGIIAGGMPLEILLGGDDIRVIEKFVPLLVSVFLYGIPSIGGFVVVAQMIQAYGTC
ncbi:hypothetical protein ACHAO8_011611 [Botrytis cinerea]